MTAALDGATSGQVHVVDALDSLDYMLGYESLWADFRQLGGRFGTRDIVNIQAFAALGRRVVMIGENPSVAEGWNTDIINAASGFLSPGQASPGTAVPIPLHYLTEGISSVTLPSTGTARGGFALFDTNFATLWGPDLNVLTVLDVNIFNENHRGNLDNARFGENVVQWVTYQDGQAPAPVPEPSSILLTTSGVAVTLARMRRRKRRGGGTT